MSNPLTLFKCFDCKEQLPIECYSADGFLIKLCALCEAYYHIDFMNVMKRKMEEKNKNKKRKNKMKTIIAIVMLFILTSCGAEKYDRFFEPNFNHIAIKVSSNLYVENVKEAIGIWNQASGDVIFVYDDISPEIQIHMMKTDEFAQLNHDLIDATAHATTGLNTCRIDVDLFQSTHSSLIAHELGHCLGFGHSNEPHSIMNALVDFDAIMTPDLLAPLTEWVEVVK